MVNWGPGEKGERGRRGRKTSDDRSAAQRTGKTEQAGSLEPKQREKECKHKEKARKRRRKRVLVSEALRQL